MCESRNSLLEWLEEAAILCAGDSWTGRADATRFELSSSLPGPGWNTRFVRLPIRSMETDRGVRQHRPADRSVQDELRTTNAIGPCQQEIRRRTGTMRSFEDDGSRERIVNAVVLVREVGMLD